MSAKFGTATPIGGVCSGTGGDFEGVVVPSGNVFSKFGRDSLAGMSATGGGTTPMGGVAERLCESFEVEASTEKVAWRAGSSTTMSVPIGVRRVGGSSNSADSAVIGSSIGGGGEKCPPVRRLRAWNAARYRSSRVLRSASGPCDMRPIHTSRLCAQVLSSKPSAWRTSARGRPDSTSAQSAANSSISISGSIRIWAAARRNGDDTPHQNIGRDWEAVFRHVDSFHLGLPHLVQSVVLTQEQQ